MVNSLKNERSPYLKQHENNPVDWLPWNRSTLNKAKKEKKPIFLSIGYASCHWCHVMAHESFENEITAKIMNDKFINIKVDREERPDLDSIFQRSLGILTGAQGGWPLSMFLDENAVPFTGGTYFPPKEMHGRPSFDQVLENVSKVYIENREKIINQAIQLRNVFKTIHRKDATLKQEYYPFVEKILQYLDDENGGFKGAPKFPQFYIFDTILYFHKKNENKKFLDVVQNLLLNVSSKGIYDHLEGGVSRYTVDEKWIIPHFEKMLYDNILYINLLNNFLQINQSDYLKSKLIQTLNFINTEFISSDKLLGSAFDADSDGIEGKYYIWKYQELQNILNKDFDLFKKKYDITAGGNFEGSNILIEKKDLKLNKDEQTDLSKLEHILLSERKKRNKPFFDNKIQTDLNCYWLYTNLFSSILLEDDNLYNQTIEKINILKEKLKNKVYHCYNKEQNEVDVFLEDYVYYSLLLVTLYEINNDMKSLEKCKVLMKETWDMFYNSNNNLLQKNKINLNDIFVNPIDISDSNIANGNSIFLFVCNKLKNITKDSFWEQKFKILSNSVNKFVSFNFSQMFSYLKVLDICNNNDVTITIFGKIKNYNRFKHIIFKKFLGTASVIYINNNDNFFVICKNQTCSEKLKNLDELENYIKNNL